MIRNGGAEGRERKREREEINSKADSGTGVTNI